MALGLLNGLQECLRNKISIDTLVHHLQTKLGQQSESLEQRQQTGQSFEQTGQSLEQTGQSFEQTGQSQSLEQTGQSQSLEQTELRNSILSKLNCVCVRGTGKQQQAIHRNRKFGGNFTNLNKFLDDAVGFYLVCHFK
jgi:hypothetical protein